MSQPTKDIVLPCVEDGHEPGIHLQTVGAGVRPALGHARRGEVVAELAGADPVGTATGLHVRYFAEGWLTFAVTAVFYLFLPAFVV